MVNWIKNIWGKIKGYIIALAGAVFGALCVVIGVKNRRIGKLENEKAEEEAKRREAERAAEKARLEAETAAAVAEENAAIDVLTREEIAEIMGMDEVPADVYIDKVEAWKEGRGSKV